MVFNYSVLQSHLDPRSQKLLDFMGSYVTEYNIYFFLYWVCTPVTEHNNKFGKLQKTNIYSPPPPLSVNVSGTVMARLTSY